MDKQKQIAIEEMAKDICVECPYPTCVPCKACDSWGYAENAINAGYRKIPEGAVVITREEYEKLCDLAYFGNGEETIRKETAEKVAEKLKEIAKDKLELYGWQMVDIDDIDEICKELTEGK